MEYVIYRESKPGISSNLRVDVIEQAINGLRLKIETLQAGKREMQNLGYIKKIVSGFDDDSLSAVIGIGYEVPDEKTDQSFTEWAFVNLFDFLLPGTWDLEYKGETNWEGFNSDFRLHKEISLSLEFTETQESPSSIEVSENIEKKNLFSSIFSRIFGIKGKE
jgi:hypothetical protein